MGSRVVTGFPNLGARDVRRHCFESRLNSLNLNTSFAMTNLSSKSPFSLGCHMMAVGLAAGSMRCEHTVVVPGLMLFTHTTPVARDDADRSYSTQYLWQVRLS